MRKPLFVIGWFLLLANANAQFATSPAGASGTAINLLTDTWTSSGTTYDGGLFLSVTDTASAASSALIDIKGGAAGTTRYFAVRKDGVFQTVGPFSLQWPDNTTVGGNVRGSGAVDLQYDRASAADVASGNDSFVAGYDNKASSLGSVAIGYQSRATNSIAMALGSGATASGSSSFALGNSGTASGTAALALSTDGAGANANYSIAIGSKATSRTVQLSRTWAGGNFATPGDAQEGSYLLRRITTDATAAVVLSADGAAPGSTTQPVMPNNSVYAFDILVSARRTDSADYGAWRIVGAIKRDANAASTALAGTPTVTTIATPSGAWTAPAAVADTTNGGLQITVAGAAAQTVRWVAKVMTTEVTN
jgi:hypothetical protein